MRGSHSRGQLLLKSSAGQTERKARLRMPFICDAEFCRAFQLETVRHSNQKERG